MALPVTISGADVRFRGGNNYQGPFLSGGAVYVVLLSYSDDDVIEVFKASDPTDSFSEQDSGDKPNLTNDCASLWVYQLGTDLHIAHQEYITGRVGYSLFHMATDQWDGTLVNLQVETPANVPTTSLGMGCSIAVRSDGDVIVLYNGDTDQEMGQPYDRVDYARKENGSFANVGIAVGEDTKNEHWHGSVIVRGSSDRMHFFFQNYTLNDAFQRTLLSDNTLEALPAAGDSGVSADYHVFAPGISYDDSGTQRVRCPYEDSSGKVSYAEFDSADAPGAFTINPDVSDNAVRTSGTGSPVACLAADGTDEYLLYSDSTDRDLYQDKNDAADTEVLDAVNINHLSSNIYDRSGTKLAYVYADGTVVKYNEVDIGVAPPAASLLRKPSIMSRFLVKR